MKVLVVWLFATPWTIACQAPLSIGFSRPEYWIELPFPSPGDLPDPGIEPRSPASQADSSPFEPPGNPCCLFIQPLIKKILRLPCVMVFPQLKTKEHLNIQDLLLRCLPVRRVVIISSYNTSWLLEAFTPKQLSPGYSQPMIIHDSSGPFLLFEILSTFVMMAPSCKGCTWGQHGWHTKVDCFPVDWGTFDSSSTPEESHSLRKVWQGCLGCFYGNIYLLGSSLEQTDGSLRLPSLPSYLFSWKHFPQDLCTFNPNLASGTYRIWCEKNWCAY